MAVISRRKKLSVKSSRIIFCTVLYSALALFAVWLFAFNANYTKVYDSPSVEHGRVDFKGVELTSRKVSCNLGGEWEFFYNEWIVTDKVEKSPDGMISLPGLWTYKNYGNGALPRTGYASYRLIAENVQAGVSVVVDRHYGNFAFRTFINGRLNYRSGTLSKNAAETVVTGRTAEEHPYLTDGGPLEIVIEVSANSAGGFNAAPWLSATVSAGLSYGNSLRSFNYIVIGVTTAAVAISVLTYLCFRYRRDITLPAFMLCLYVHFLCSKDMMYVLSMPYPVAATLGLFSAIASVICFVFHLLRCGAPVKKPPAIVGSAVAAFSTAMLLGFYGTPLSPVFGFALFAVGCGCLTLVALNKKFTTAQRWVYGALFVFLLSVFLFELCDGLGLLVFGTEFIFTVELTFIIACFTVLWIFKLAKAANTAIRVSELENELTSVRHEALKAQIKPHFVYNSLTAIQSRYRDGLDEGDRAIEQFARHLRLITDSGGKDIIAFEDEVRNVLNYFELENLRADGKLNLLLDLDFTDFSVPVLSIQPLVENAIRHGGLREKPDGYIRLCSEKIAKAIVITVEDNGAGFDPSAAREGVGIENTRKRLGLIGATMSLESRIGCGTTVKIEIPLE